MTLSVGPSLAAILRVWLLIGALLSLAACSPAAGPATFSPTHPNLFLNQAEIAELRARIATDREPWASAFAAFIAHADTALSLPPGSVTYNGGGRVWKTQQPYSSDGVYDPGADRQDYVLGATVSDAILALGLAYQLTGRAAYAEKAIHLIEVWFLHAPTSLRAGTGAGNEIEVWISMPAAFYGIDLLWNYPAFPVSDKEALQRWAQTSADRIRTLRRDNNWENWRLVYLMSLAHTAGDQAAMDSAIERWRTLMEQQIDERGFVTTELSRTLSLDYSLFALDPMAQGAEIARHYGVDLYGYRNSRGQGLETVFDAHVPYLLDPDSWPFEQISPFDAKNNGVAIYELAYSRYGPKEGYRLVIDANRRPLTETRTLGHITLTHGSAFAPGP